MNPSLIVALAALIPVSAALFFLFRNMSSRSGAGISIENSLEFSPDRYRPMERLLREDDFRFIESQPGYTADMGRRFRAARRRVFRGYLRCIKRDFAVISLTFHTLIIHSAEDRGDLAAALVRQRLMFSLAMAMVQARVLLHAAGLGPVNVDVNGLVDSLVTMQTQMRTLLTPPETAMSSL